MGRVIAVLSHKGGTGKTALVQNIGYELSQRGRVLLVDFDPQSNLTVGCGVEPGTLDRAILHALHDSAETPTIVQPLPFGDLLPATLDLALAEQQFAAHYDRNNKLEDAVRAVQQEYDYVLIDTPPSLGFFAFNSLTAADEVLIPLQCQPYALRAVESTLQLVKLVQRNKSNLAVKAIVLTMYDRRIALTKSVEEAARTRYGTQVATATVPVNVAIAEAGLAGKPVGIYAASSRGAKAYATLTEELYGQEK